MSMSKDLPSCGVSSSVTFTMAFSALFAPVAAYSSCNSLRASNRSRTFATRAIALHPRPDFLPEVAHEAAHFFILKIRNRTASGARKGGAVRDVTLVKIWIMGPHRSDQLME